MATRTIIVDVDDTDGGPIFSSQAALALQECIDYAIHDGASPLGCAALGAQAVLCAYLDVDWRTIFLKSQKNNKSVDTKRLAK